MLKVVPPSSPVKELEGFLVECDEDTGFVSFTATNLQSSIQRRIKTNIETGSSFVIFAKIITQIISILDGDDVNFSMTKDGWITVSGGNCTYTLPVLLPQNYPKPEMPFPEDTIKITRICDMYTRTANTVGNDSNKLSLTGIHLDIFSDMVKAVGCDGNRMATLKSPSDCGGKLSITIPKISLYHLANAVTNDDVLDVGICGKSIVFMKNGLLFTSRLIDEVYMDSDAVMNYNDKCYTAVVEAGALAEAVDSINMFAKLSDDSPRMKMRFLEDQIDLSIQCEATNAQMVVPAIISKPMPEDGFYYNTAYFADCFKTVKGKLEIFVSSKGMAILSDSVSQYMMTNTRPTAITIKPKKDN